MDVYDRSILLNIIRKREFELIMDFISRVNPPLILDYGCGSGWLSWFLFNNGFKVIGIDINRRLIIFAKRVVPDVEFVVCDAHRLPFRNCVFDCIIGVGILHHLDLTGSLWEIKRIGRDALMFMEPNKLNFLSHIGRTLFPMEIHTMGEKPFIPSYLRFSFEKAGIRVKRAEYLFCVVFPLARLFKLLRVKAPNFVFRVVSLIEMIVERIPLLRRLNSTIVIHGVIK